MSITALDIVMNMIATRGLDYTEQFALLMVNGAKDYSATPWAEALAIVQSMLRANETMEASKKKLTQQEKDMVAAGDHIRAIQSMRARANIPLKDAKDIVDVYRAEIYQASK